MKRDLLPDVKDPVAIDLMRALKRMLDPNGILNPGKVLWGARLFEAHMDTARALAISDSPTPTSAAVVSLWERCGLTRPWNDPAADIALARRGDNATSWSGATARSWPRSWSAMTAIAAGSTMSRRSRASRQGYGRTIMAAAEDWLRQRGIVKLMLMVRRDNTKVQAFYETLDYAEQDRVIYAKWLDGREPTP